MPTLNERRTLWAVLCLALAALVVARPQQPADAERPMPYEYNYKVENQTSGTYFGADETGTDTGRVDGSYYVWLPDNRLMTVKYYIDGESGFVPTITFSDANPFSG